MECLICGKTVSDGDKLVVQNPTIQGLKTLISAAEKRQDRCAKNILDQKDDILTKKKLVKYHLDCRKSYTSLQNLQHASQIVETECNNACSSQSRIHNRGFDIRTMCLICNKTGKKGKNQQLTSVQVFFFD